MASHRESGTGVGNGPRGLTVLAALGLALAGAAAAGAEERTASPDTVETVTFL
jgi:hypothetical protein